MKKTSKKAPPRRITLREESLAENKALGLEETQKQMNVIFGILHEHGINSQLWMEEYFTASEANGWKAPEDLEKYLPWNLSPEIKTRLSKDSFFSHGNATFVRTGTGTVFHLRKDGTRVEIVIGDLTWEEFEELTRVG